VKYISNFSGGLCSFFASKRLVDEFGPASVVNLFADVLIEHPDLYEFNRRSEDLLGVPITRISLEISPWELFRKEGLIGNDRSPICSVRLKREPLNAWMASHYELDSGQQNAFYGPATVALGFDFTEWNRVNDFQNAHPTWRIRAPMTEAPVWDKCKMISEATRLGFKMPELYVMGFPHNNCGGACVRSGISHFVHLYRVLPAKYLEWEAEELATQDEFRRRGIENWNFTILKDRRGGVTKPLTLRTLRLRIEAGEEFDKNDWGGCGCGSAA
jgi:hypothetical protein